MAKFVDVEFTPADIKSVERLCSQIAEVILEALTDDPTVSPNHVHSALMSVLIGSVAQAAGVDIPPGLREGVAIGMYSQLIRTVEELSKAR
jgi:hypothetical protein